MGSVTDGLDPWQFAQALGYGNGAYAVNSSSGFYGSGSATDGVHIYAPAATPAPSPTPAPAAAPAAAAPAPAPYVAPSAAPAAPAAAAPVDTGPTIDPIGPGKALGPQPTSLGNQLGNTVLNPPQMFWVGGQDSYDNSRRTSGQGRMKTTQT